MYCKFTPIARGVYLLTKQTEAREGQNRKMSSW